MQACVYVRVYVYMYIWQGAAMGVRGEFARRHVRLRFGGFRGGTDGASLFEV